MTAGRPRKELSVSREQIQQWIEVEGRTHAWVAGQIGYAPGWMTEVLRRLGIQSKPRGPRRGAGHGRWLGGRTIDGNGYVLIRVYGRPSASKSPSKHNGGAYIAEHRLVMENHLGRSLLATEVVHHRNGDKQDNRIENLELFGSNAEHLRHELTGRVPRWTEAGLARMRANRSRPRVHPLDATAAQPPAPDAPPSPRKSARKRGSPDTAGPAP